MVETRIDATDQDGGEQPRTWSSSLVRVATHFLIVGTVVGLLAYLGIWSRLHESLASFWPANAVLAGVLVRWPQLRSPGGWAGAVFGYYLADLTTGGTFMTTTWLTLANLVGVIVAVTLLKNLPRVDRELQRPQSVLRIMAIGAIAAITATMTGIPVGVSQFGHSVSTAAESWFSTELAGYVTCLVVVLSIPRRSPGPRPTLPEFVANRNNWSIVSSMAVFIATLAVAPTLGGPGALMLAVPVLGWIAVNGSVFQTAAFGLIGTGTLEIMLRAGRLDPGFDYNAMSSYGQASLRIGLCLMFIGPLMVATTSQRRLGQLAELRAATTFDAHTGVLTRATVQKQAQAAIDRTTQDDTTPDGQFAAFMVDVDHFKTINDTYRHSSGDAVLTAIAQRCRNSLREKDIFGRFGGDEFFGLLVGVTRAEAEELAHRMLEQTSRDPIGTNAGPIDCTVSIGVAHTDDCGVTDFAQLLEAADQALYWVKRQGRGDVALSPARACKPSQTTDA